MTARTLLLLATTGALSACAGLGGPPPQFNGLGSPKAPIVSQETRFIDLATAGSSLAAGEADRAADWLTDQGFGYGDRVALDDGTGGGGGAARADMARVVGRYGLVLSEAVPVTEGQVAPGTVRLVVLRATARVEGCPNWSTPAFLPPRDQPNFGCAGATNLAAMVADANDLLVGKSAPDTGSAAAVGTKAIVEYQKATGTSSGGTQVRAESAPGGGGN